MFIIELSLRNLKNMLYFHTIKKVSTFLAFCKTDSDFFTQIWHIFITVGDTPKESIIFVDLPVVCSFTFLKVRANLKKYLRLEGIFFGCFHRLQVHKWNSVSLAEVLGFSPKYLWNFKSIKKIHFNFAYSCGNYNKLVTEHMQTSQSLAK